MDAFPSDLIRRMTKGVETALADTPVVCLLGPRQVGKTTLARSLSPGRAYLNLDDPVLAESARRDLNGFVAGLPEKVTIDEVQRVPELLPVIKTSVDQNRRPGRFLLTGSANLLLLPKVSESLAGRMEIVPLQPLAECEKQGTPGAFLGNFLKGTLQAGFLGTPAAPDDLANRLVCGGFPEPYKRGPQRARSWHRQYIRALVERDIPDISNLRSGDDVTRLLEMLALRTGQLLNTSSLATDLKLHRETVENQITVLERLFLVRRLHAWHRNAANRLVKSPKLHLVDAGLAASLSDLKAGDWLTQRNRFGHILESFVLQQLACQADWTDPDLRFCHYRDKDKVEVDLVLTKGSKVWGIEVKASATVQDGDCHGLRRLADQAGKDFQGGVLFHTGIHTLPFGPRIFAAPVSALWEA